MFIFYNKDSLSLFLFWQTPNYRPLDQLHSSLYLHVGLVIFHLIVLFIDPVTLHFYIVQVITSLQSHVVILLFIISCLINKAISSILLWLCLVMMRVNGGVVVVVASYRIIL